MSYRMIFFSLLLTACSSGPAPEIVDPAEVAYQSNGFEKFFLPELPSWANASLAASCMRSYSVKYLDIQQARQTTELAYADLVDLQVQYNQRWRAAAAASPLGVLTPREENTLFQQTLEQIKAGLKELRFPHAQQVFLVWWDDVKNSGKDGSAPVEQLRRLASKGVPVVLVSVCTHHAEMDAWIDKNNLSDEGLFTVGIDALTPFLPGFIMGAGLRLPVNSFFPEGTTLILYKTGRPVGGELPAGIPTANFP